MPEFNLTCSPTPNGVDRWSYHFHLSLVDGRKASAFISFLRKSSTSADVNHQSQSDNYHLHSHVVQFAISLPPATSIASEGDVNASSKPSSKGRYLSTSAMDSNHLHHLRHTMQTDTLMDPFIRSSFLDMLGKGKVPAPDSLLADDSVSVLTEGSVVLDLNVTAHARDGSYGFDLDFIPPTEKESIPYELDSGVGCSVVPRCKVSGTLRLDGANVVVDSTGSSAWFETEIGGNVGGADQVTATKTESSWISAALQLSHGWGIKLHTVWDVNVLDGSITLRVKKAVLVSPEGKLTTCEEYDLEALHTWSSMSTLNDYGTKFKLNIQEMKVELTLNAAFPQQEFETICEGRAYWKGRVEVIGKVGEDSVDGLGFIEIRPAQYIASLEKYLKRAALLTTLEVSKIYPERLLSPEHAMKTFGFNSMDYVGASNSGPNAVSNPVSDNNPLRYMQNVSLDVLYQHVFAPVRHLINGTGKSWRSYMSMLSISILGADPEPYRPLVAAIELVHTGTLIIDDIQDESPIRRGVPAVHTVWGLASAINAGEAAYFAFHTAIQSIPDLTAETKLGVLEIFFETMRLAHAGQALDIAGQQQSLLDDILAGKTEPAALEKCILSVHRLKTAVVAGNIAKMAALFAGAKSEQTKVLAAHWERVGLAFQIVDDVYDIRRGSQVQNQKEEQRTGNPAQKPLKRRGDDIRSGKISIPIAKAGQMMPLEEAKWVWETVLNKPEDDETTQKVIGKLEEYGVVEKCIEDAQRMVDESWAAVEEHLEDNQAKVFIHALCRYMGEYHSI